MISDSILTTILYLHQQNIFIRSKQTRIQATQASPQNFKMHFSSAVTTFLAVSIASASPFKRTTASVLNDISVITTDVANLQAAISLFTTGTQAVSHLPSLKLPPIRRTHTLITRILPASQRHRRRREQPERRAHTRYH